MTRYRSASGTRRPTTPSGEVNGTAAPAHKERPASPATLKSDLSFPVVGIGASAGGTTALQTFFESAPTSMDMAFVVVVHLAPEQVSHMDAVLQRTTGMPVHQVTSTVPIEKNHIYVIAPGMQLEMSDGCLRCRSRDQSDENLSAFLWARRLNNRLSTRLRESLAEQDSKLVHR